MKCRLKAQKAYQLCKNHGNVNVVFLFSLSLSSWFPFIFIRFAWHASSQLHFSWQRAFSLLFLLIFFFVSVFVRSSVRFSATCRLPFPRLLPFSLFVCSFGLSARASGKGSAQKKRDEYERKSQLSRQSKRKLVFGEHKV